MMKSLQIDTTLPQFTTTNIVVAISREKREAAKFIALCTFRGKQMLNGTDLEHRTSIFAKNLNTEEMATLILAILNMEKTQDAIIQLGIDKEQDTARRISDIKNRQGNNSITTGGVSLYGSLISAACEKYGWTYDECVWGISYANLRLMLADSVNTHVLDEKERRLVNVPRPGEKVVDAGDRSNIERLTKEYLNQKD